MTGRRCRVSDRRPCVVEWQCHLPAATFAAKDGMFALATAHPTPRFLADRIPFLADLKPSGKYVMEDLHKARQYTYCTEWVAGQPGLIAGLVFSCSAASVRDGRPAQGKVVAYKWRLLAGCSAAHKGPSRVQHAQRW